MATTDLNGAPERADHAGTAPLPPAAAEVASRIEVHSPLVRAVTQYETASVCAVQLAAMAESGRMSDLDADSLAHAEELMAGARATLAAAGMLHLIGAS